MGGNGKFLNLTVSMFRSSRSRTSITPPPPPTPPPEYICPVCNTLFTEPIVIASGHTFDKTCFQVCLDLNYTPTLTDGTVPDFSTQMIPNKALQTAIPKWCEENGVDLGEKKSYADVVEKVRVLVEESKIKNLLDGLVMNDKPNVEHSRAYTDFTPKGKMFDSTSSDEFSNVVSSPITPLPLKTRPSCLSPFHDSSSELQYSGAEEDDDEFIAQFNSNDPYDQEQGAISLRRITRTDEDARLKLCTERLLLAIRELLLSSYEKVQVNAIAALVNLSLEKSNKIKIVRSGIVPTVIDLLKVRLSETQEHAAGVIFSLSLEEKNRTAIGVLGALPPLMNCLIRSESLRTRSDSALALYNLASDHSNRVKLVKLGSVGPLLTVLRLAEEAVAGRVILVLYQLASSNEGKAAMLDGNAVEHLVAVLRSGGVSESTRENCVAALCTLSQGSMRFKALARDAKAVEVLKVVEETGNERAKEKAKRILAVLMENGEVDWKTTLESGGVSRVHHRVLPGHGKTAEF